MLVSRQIFSSSASKRALGKAAKFYRRYWRAIKSGLVTTFNPAAKRQDDDIDRLYATAGAEQVAHYFHRKYAGDTDRFQAAVVAAAKRLGIKVAPETEFQILKQAADLKETEGLLRALYWAAQRTLNLKDALGCIRKLHALYGPSPTKGQQTFLDKLNRSAAFQLSVFDQLDAKPAHGISGVPGRICYALHNSLPYASGGYATRAQGLALGLKKAGMEVIAITRPGFPTDAKPELQASQINVEEDVDGILYRRLLTPSRNGKSALEYLNASADALTELFREIRPSIVMAASNYQTAVPALIAARRLGLPFIYEIRGFWEITRVSRDPAFRQLPGYAVQELMEAEAATHADHVFTLTLPMKEEMVRRGVAADHMTLLPNSCEPERFSPRARDAVLCAKYDIPVEAAVIGYIGTFVQYEGLELLTAAAAKLRARGYVFRLLLVGNENVAGQDVGPITTEIHRIAREEGLEDWLIMPGRVPHEEVEAYYSLIDVAPFPRKSQPVTEMVSPMKPLEAFAMEKAVVASDVAALAEMIEDGVTGLLFKKDDVDSLCSVLAELIVNPQMRARIGGEARKWVEKNRTWSATAQIAVNKIQQVLDERKSADAAD